MKIVSMVSVSPHFITENRWPLLIQIVIMFLASNRGENIHHRVRASLNVSIRLHLILYLPWNAGNRLVICW